jgi:leucyl aminopeptidase
MAVKLSVRRADAAKLDTPLLAVALSSPAALPRELKALNDALGGALARAVDRKDFRGDRDETLHLSGGSKGPARVLLVGTG